MTGSLIGDIVGSVYEWKNVKRKDFDPLFSPKGFFTDDSVLTLALAYAILHNEDYEKCLVEFSNKYSGKGYGGRYRKWVADPNRTPYNSFGNGAGMRIGPCGWAYGTLDETLEKAEIFSNPTHNHPLGIQGAQAIAGSIFLARNGKTKEEIKEFAEKLGYSLVQTLDEIRPDYRFNETCQGSVPQAIQAFLESENFEDAVRGAISIGGDSDTIACMSGSIAEAFYGNYGKNNFGVSYREIALCYLDEDLIDILNSFEANYGGGI